MFAQRNGIRGDLVDFYQDYADEGSHMVWPGLEGVASSALRRKDFMSEVGEKTEINSGTAIDIGCGWGAFMVTLKDYGYDPVGIEICRKMAFWGREHLKLQITTSPLEHVTHWDPVDLVSMCHVFEHIPNPLKYLDCVKRHLKPGGLFIGIVPNFGSYCSVELGKDWYWLDPNYHYVHYTPKTLEEMLGRGGFQLMEQWTRIGDYTEAEVAKVVRSRNPDLEPEAVIKKVSKLGESGQGEELRFIARKRNEEAH